MEALSYCHNLCITHRDIKLENIILDKSLNPKLIDFGFSTCFPTHQKVIIDYYLYKNLKIKLFCGTPSYMAPEIL